MTPKTRKQIKADHHARQVAAGRVMSQVYVPVETHERAKRLARLQDVTLAHIYAEAVYDYCDRSERDEVAALRAALGMTPSRSGSALTGAS
jgi:hypothetical protein